MPDVFLSYSREDQAAARPFAEGLEREGFSVWWDQALSVGESFDTVTERALAEAGIVVVLWSKRSVNSRWVRAEATEGQSSGRLAPVMIEPCKRPIMFELTHTADLVGWKGDAGDARWRSFVEGLRRIKGGNAAPATSPGTPVAATSPAPGGWRRRPLLWLAPAAALLVIAAGFAWFQRSADAQLQARPAVLPGDDPAAAGPALRDYEISQLTTSGTAVHPAISPDGKYVVYVQPETGNQPDPSIWIRQVATSSNIQIVPPRPGIALGAPAITPDGNFVDFVQGQALTPALWRVPLLGGDPVLLAERAASAVGWSPDGRQMAFVRVSANASALVVADADGGGERVLATRQEPLWFVNINFGGRPTNRPAWSPDGKVIALFDNTGRGIVFVDVATGAETIRNPGGSPSAQGLAWLGAGSLVLSQREALEQRVQLWRMSYPDGGLSPLTNDLSSYIGVDVDGTRSSLVTSRREARISLWVGDATGADSVQVVSPSLFGGTVPWLAWAGERLLYDTAADGRAAVAAVVPGGASQEVIANASQGVGTADGGTIVFFDRNGELSRSDAAGRRQAPLGAGRGYELRLSPDDRHVIFKSGRSDVQSLWTVPIEGGEPVEISRANAGDYDVSANGRLLIRSWDDTRESFIVCDLPACANRREFDLPANFVGVFAGKLRWSPDGRDITYVDASGTNLWRLPLDGGPPTQITHFAADAGAYGRIARFAWSRDGKRLALVRMTTTEDIVLLRLRK